MDVISVLAHVISAERGTDCEQIQHKEEVHWTVNHVSDVSEVIRAHDCPHSSSDPSII